MSFRDKAVFSFEATKDKTLEDYYVIEVAPNVRLLRFAIVFGANASGKSNILKAFSFLKTFWFEAHQSMDEGTGVTPFLLDSIMPNVPSEFQLKFWVNGVRYWYLLSLNRRYVEKEVLYYYKTNSRQPTKLFERFYENGQSTLKFNPSSVKVSSVALTELTLKCLPNVSFFVARNRVNISLPLIDAAIEWMRKKMLPYIAPSMDLFEYAGERICSDSELKNYLLDFIHRADFNISDVFSENNDRMYSEDADSGATAHSRIATRFRHAVTNGRGDEIYALSSAMQSEGTRRIIGVESAIFDAIRHGAFLSIDELESSLHPDLMEYVIEHFLKNKDESQLLVTSHYDALLDTVGDLLRKDVVWFAEKDLSGNSKLYSLVEFSGLNKLTSIRRSYRNGRFGALPNIR